MSVNVHARRVFDAEEVSELAVIAAVMNYEVCDLSGFE
jgi:hypothetical protein